MEIYKDQQKKKIPLFRINSYFLGPYFLPDIFKEIKNTIDTEKVQILIQFPFQRHSSSSVWRLPSQFTSVYVCAFS